MIISTWAQNEDSVTPTQDDLQMWVDRYGLTMPVVADDNWTINNRFEKDGGIPTQVLLAPGAKLVKVDQMITHEDIEAVLPN
jgi:hypothetical protein